MKRFFPVVLIVIVFWLSSQISVYADVVWGNTFLEQNRNHTIPVDRTFQANGPMGHINLVEKPGLSKVLVKYENGRNITIGHAYRHMGKYWGIQRVSHLSGTMGWVPMDQLLLFYDSIDFINDHQNEVHDFNGRLDFLLNVDSLYIWKWPGSDREKIIYDNSERFLDENALYGRYSYVDSEGREWVFTMLWGGIDRQGGMQPGPLPGEMRAEGWICIDDPQNGQIPAFNPAPEPVIWSPQAGYSITHEQRQSETQLSLIYVVFAAAIAVVIVSIVILLIRKNRYM